MSAEFERNVWCVLGLPFDAVNLAEVSEDIYGASVSRRPLVISTPNLNFTVIALQDADFRNTVIDSERSLADGMPLIWVARILRLGIVSKVSGSDLFEYLVFCCEVCD